MPVGAISASDGMKTGGWTSVFLSAAAGPLRRQNTKSLPAAVAMLDSLDSFGRTVAASWCALHPIAVEELFSYCGL
jgi:hypothetical protein